MAVHPANAVFVSGDGKVSFNENGRKLDSLGNVVWGDRQGLRGARARVRPEIEEAYRKMDEEAAQQASQPVMPTYQPPAGMGTQPVAPTQQQAPANPWRSVSQWGQPGLGAAPPARPAVPAWEPPPSGMGVGMEEMRNWNQFRPPAQQQQPPAQQWNQYRPPRSYNPYMP